MFSIHIVVFWYCYHCCRIPNFQFSFFSASEIVSKPSPTTSSPHREQNFRETATIITTSSSIAHRNQKVERRSKGGDPLDSSSVVCSVGSPCLDRVERAASAFSVAPIASPETESLLEVTVNHHYRVAEASSSSSSRKAGPQTNKRKKKTIQFESHSSSSSRGKDGTDQNSEETFVRSTATTTISSSTSSRSATAAERNGGEIKGTGFTSRILYSDL